jgi:hypothetical protein
MSFCILQRVWLALLACFKCSCAIVVPYIVFLHRRRGHSTVSDGVLLVDRTLAELRFDTSEAFWTFKFAEPFALKWLQQDKRCIVVVSSKQQWQQQDELLQAAAPDCSVNTSKPSQPIMGVSRSSWRQAASSHCVA